MVFIVQLFNFERMHTTQVSMNKPIAEVFFFILIARIINDTISLVVSTK